MQWGPFLGVETGNEVTLDFMDAGEYDFSAQHYAFLVSETEFDEIFGRVPYDGLDLLGRSAVEPGEINHHDGGRGVYFDDSTYLLEIISPVRKRELSAGARSPRSTTTRSSSPSPTVM